MKAPANRISEWSTPRARRVAVPLIAVLCVVLWPATAPAQSENAGTSAANFLLLSGSAADAGLAGAGLAISNDLGGLSINPAGLGWLQRTQLALGHAPTDQTSSRDWLSFGGRTSWGGLHLAGGAVYHSLGSFDGRDALGQPTGSFSANDLAASVTLARTVHDLATVGLTVKYVREDLSTVTGSGTTFDVGGQLHLGNAAFGLAAQNVGGAMNYAGASYRFPTNIGLGSSYAIPRYGLRVLLDFNSPNDYSSDLRGGVEWLWNQTVALRAGYRKELGGPSDDLLNGPTFGLGAGKNGLWLDYAFEPDANTGEHRLSLRIIPGLFHSGSAGEALETSPLPPHDKPAPRVTETATTAAPQETATPRSKSYGTVPVDGAPPPKATTPVTAPAGAAAASQSTSSAAKPAPTPAPTIGAPAAMTSGAAAASSAPASKAPATAPSAAGAKSTADGKAGTPVQAAPAKATAAGTAAVASDAKASAPLQTPDQAAAKSDADAAKAKDDAKQAKVEADKKAEAEKQAKAEAEKKAEADKKAEAEKKAAAEKAKRDKHKPGKDGWTDAEREAAERAGIKLPKLKK